MSDPRPDETESRTTLTDTQRWVLATLAAVVVVLAGVATVAALTGDDDEQTTTTTTTEPTTTTTTEATTTTVPEDTTTTSFAPAVDAFDVAFPAPDSSRRFDSPESAARSYATDVLGFGDVAVDAGEWPEGDTTEVVLRDGADGPETAVELRQFDDGAWYVLGSTTGEVVVSQPTPGASLASPFETTGEALAFEGAVEVVVLAQGDPTPLGTGTVTGSGVPPAAPFSGTVEFTPPAEPTPGVLVYRVRSPEDGRVVQATSFRVRLTPL